MLNFSEAKYLVEMKIREIEEKSRIELALLEMETIEFEYGWMFFYQSKEYVQTGREGAMVGGNAPIIVDKLNCSVHITGTRREANFYIGNYCKYRDDPEKFKTEIRR